MAVGRRARANLAVDTRPGQVLLLALLANLPVFLVFILVPLFARSDPTAGLRMLPAVWVATPALAVWSLVVYLRSPPERRAHNAAKIGLLLAVTALLMWAMAVALSLAKAGGA